LSLHVEEGAAGEWRPDVKRRDCEVEAKIQVLVGERGRTIDFVYDPDNTPQQTKITPRSV
jgi:hypothetical protein